MNMPPKKVLIVDDEEDLTWTLTRKLSKDNNEFEILAVNSGKEALEILNQIAVDMVVTDVRMPEVSGLELLQRVKQQYPFTKVVIMTAYGSSDVQKEANSRGCFQYIEKPFEINDLKQIILEGLGEKGGFKGNVSDFQLSDLIQLNCLGRLTIALKVKHGNEEGTIYFKDGNIVHAEKNGLEGEEAFYHIMGWKSGEFSVIRDVKIPGESISTGWQSLLLEGLRRADENSPLAREDKEQEKYWRHKKIESVLNKLKKTEGVKHILIHSKVGDPIFYVGMFNQDRDKITELGEEVSALMRNFENAKRVLNNQSLKYWEVQLDSYTMFLHKIPYHNAFFTLIGNNNLDSGYTRLEIRKSLMLIAQLV